MPAVDVEILKAEDLGPAEAAVWEQFRASSPQLASPYFDLRYVKAAAEIAPHAGVALIHRAGRIAGFLPFQRRGSLIQPLGAPISDYHGLIAEPTAAISLPEVVRKLGAQRFRFSSLVGAAPSGGAPLFAMAADLSAGFDGWLDARQAAGRAGFLKDKRRRLRQLERDIGPLRFAFGMADPTLLDEVIAQKRAQIRRTAQHDIFACGWTTRLLHHLNESGQRDFGLQVAALYAGDRLVAAEIGLRSGSTHHLWFPVYDASLARYSPGSLMTIETLRAAAEAGVRTVDFGPGFESYKNDYADPSNVVHEGTVGAGARVTAVGTDALGSIRRIVRRFDRIAACEPAWPGRIAATSTFAADVARRRPGVSLGIGAAIGVTVGLSLFAE